MDAELTRPARALRCREALERDGLDAALVCGTEYTGFEGAVTYLSGFQIVHRYAYVLAAARGRSGDRLPGARRATSGEHGDVPDRRSRSSPTGRASGSPTGCAGSASASTGSTT